SEAAPPSRSTMPAPGGNRSIPAGPRCTEATTIATVPADPGCSRCEAGARERGAGTVRYEIHSVRRAAAGATGPTLAAAAPTTAAATARSEAQVGGVAGLAFDPGAAATAAATTTSSTSVTT